jgi:hypothetical protein
VAQAFVPEGYPNPRRAGAGFDLALPFTHLLKSFRLRNPAPKPQEALPVRARRMDNKATSSTRRR